MRDALGVFGQVFRNRALRRVEIGFAAFQAAEYAVWIAVLVYAFDRGGTNIVALVAIVQLVPAALFAPVAGAFADRYPPARVLSLGYAAQAAGMVGTAVVLFADGPAVAVYALSAVAATAVTITRPTQAVLLPALARTPDELTAANVVTGWIETAMALAGPAIAGGLLALGSPGAVFAVFALAVGAGAILVAPVGGRRAHRAEPVAAGAIAELTAGFRALGRHPHPRMLVTLLALAYVVWGALDILTVVLAIDVLHLGDGGTGYLVAAFGVGGIVGAALAVLLVGRKRLVPPILLASLVWGGAFSLVGVSESVVAAVLLVALGGLGQSLLDVAGRTLLQRISPSDVLARIFGVHEAMTMLALALGAVIVPPLVAAGGATLAFGATGALLPIFVLVFLRRLLAVDGAATVPIVEISLLRSMRIFSRLLAPAVEGLAHNLEPVLAPAGTRIIREGEIGDRYYAVADGEVEVTVGGKPVNRIGRGDGFGEIALLRDVPRTATVTARVDTQLYALDRDAFLIALTGHAPAAALAHTIADEREAETAAFELEETMNPLGSDDTSARGDHADG